MSPLRIVRRRTRATERSVAGGGAASCAGGRCCRASWGRPVVVHDVLTQRSAEMPFAVDEGVVEALSARGAYPPFRESPEAPAPACARSAFLPPEDSVERSDELRYPEATTTTAGHTRSASRRGSPPSRPSWH
jgi:hypothetical protein